MANLNDLWVAALQDALDSSSGNLLDLQEAYLAEAGFDTWTEWANDLSGGSLTVSNDALLAAFKTISSSSTFNDALKDFIEGDGFALYPRDGLLFKSGGFLSDYSGIQDGSGSRDGALGGASYLFDGTDDVVILPNVFDGAKWVACRLKTTTNDTNYRRVMTNADPADDADYWNICLHNGNVACAYHRSAGYLEDTSPLVNDGAWHDIIFDKENQKIYVDGVDLLAPDLGAGSFLSSASPSFGGRSDAAATTLVTGNMQDVVISTVSMTASDIVNYSNGIMPSSVGDGAIYRCMEGFGSVVIDSSGNGNHGYASGVTYATFNDSQAKYDERDKLGFNIYPYVDGYDAVSTNAMYVADNAGVHFHSMNKFSVIVDVIIGYQNTADASHYLFFKGAGTSSCVRLMLASGSRFYANVDCATTDASRAPTLVYTEGSRYRLVMVYNEDDDQKIKLYANGSLLTGGTDTAGVGAQNERLQDMLVGTYSLTSNRTDAIWNEFLIYDDALSGSAVADDYAGTIQSANKVRHWKFKNRSGNISDEVAGDTLVVGSTIADAYLLGSTDAFGNDREITGKARYPLKITQSNCGTFTAANKEYIDLGTNDYSDAKFVWLRYNTSSSAANMRLVTNGGQGSGHDWTVQVSAGTLVCAQHSSGANAAAVTTATTYADGEWNTVGFNLQDLEILFNNVDQTVNIVTSVYSVDGNPKIGAKWSSDFAYDGQMADVWILNAVPTAAQLLDAEAGLGFPKSIAMAHVPISEGGEVGSCQDRITGEFYTIQNLGSAATFWGTTQDVWPGNFLNGFSVYTHATAPDIRVMYDLDGVAFAGTPPTGYSLDTDYPQPSSYFLPTENVFDLNPNSFSVIDNAVSDTTLTYTQLVYNFNSEATFFIDDNTSVLFKKNALLYASPQSGDALTKIANYCKEP